SYWRALGFPEPRPGERLFSETDLDMLASVLPFIAEGVLDPGLGVQMARVIGSSLSRVATAQIEAIEHQIATRVEADDAARAGGAPRRGDDLDGEDLDGDLDDDDGEHEDGADGGLGLDDLAGDLGPGLAADLADDDLADAARRAAELLPMMPQLMEFVWRRHLGAAARRRIMRASASTPTEDVCVGFADLVGFTAQTQQLPEEALARVVDRFETIAYDTVIAHGGRVVKTIGDEVLFLADAVTVAAEIALELSVRYREDESLSDVRVALAAGSILERDGDVYGAAVNKAHRIVTVAYPGSVVVARDVVDALADDDRFSCRSIRSHYLKDIGRVPLYTLRWADDETEGPYARARARRAARREFLLQRRVRRRRESADALEDALAELPVDGPVEPDGDDGRRLVADAGDDGARAGGDATTGLADGLSALLLDDEDELAVAATGEFEALTDAVLGADLEPEAQLELLADLAAARRLHGLEEEAQKKAAEADHEAERKLEEIEEEARRKVDQIEAESRRRIDEVLQEAEEKSRKVNEEASRKVRRVAEEAERKADRAEREARREAKRRTAKRQRTERQRDEQPEVADAGGEGDASAPGADRPS
ncbi:MAG: adenylate/guanylate cyclase domain-containing protein, partial [Acidimicrobiales bacterium]